MRNSLQTLMSTSLHCDEEPYHIEVCANLGNEIGQQPKHVPSGPVLSLFDRLHQIGPRSSSDIVTVYNLFCILREIYYISKRNILGHNLKRALLCFYRCVAVFLFWWKLTVVHVKHELCSTSNNIGILW